MITVILSLISSFLDQLSSVFIKKTETAADQLQHLSIWSTAWVTNISSFVFVLFLSIYRGFQFPEKILWLIFVRIFFEWFQTYFTLKSLKLADLSLYNFVRSLTIVASVLIDIFILKTHLAFQAYIGIGLIVFGLMAVYFQKLVGKSAWIWPLASAMNGALLFGITKYIYNHADPMSSEVIVRIGMLLFFLFMVVRTESWRQIYKSFNKLTIFLIPIRAATSLLNITALNLGSISIYSAVDRAGSVIWGVILGKRFFAEQSFLKKLLISIVIAVGIFLLVLK